MEKTILTSPSLFYSDYFYRYENQLRNLSVDAQCENATFKEIERIFCEVSKLTITNIKSFDFHIKIGGEEFYKALLIMTQYPQFFISNVRECSLIEKETDGFSRLLSIPNAESVIQERVFIDHSTPNQAAAIFVKTDNIGPDFACINKVYLQEGLWHWTGIYLYGSSLKEFDFNHEFELIALNMLKFMQSNQFNSIFEGLIKT